MGKRLDLFLQEVKMSKSMTGKDLPKSELDRLYGVYTDSQVASMPPRKRDRFKEDMKDKDNRKRHKDHFTKNVLPKINKMVDKARLKK